MAYPNQSVVEAQNIALGQGGSVFVEGTGVITAKGGVFIAIQFLEDSVFASDNSNGLVPESSEKWPSSSGTCDDVSENGAVTNGETFPQGMTIFGRWTKFQLASGKVIAYLGG